MSQKFNCGDQVKLIGVVRDIHSVDGEVFWLGIEVEGWPMFLPQHVLINQSAVREFDDNDKKFFESRGG